MATFDDAKALVDRLPEVTVSISFGTPSLKVRGKNFCRMWGEREYDRNREHDTEVLVVRTYPRRRRRVN